MDIYILQKDTLVVLDKKPFTLKAGLKFHELSCKNFFVLNGTGYMFPKEAVVNNHEWFTIKQPINYAELLPRPPIGVIPEWMWVEARVKELTEYIERKKYQDCETNIEEWNRHVNYLMNRKIKQPIKNIHT